MNGLEKNLDCFVVGGAVVILMCAWLGSACQGIGGQMIVNGNTLTCEMTLILVSPFFARGGFKGIY